MWTLALLGTTACIDSVSFGDGGGFGDVGGEDGFDDREVHRAAEPPPPISGGTLLVLRDGDTVVATDPDRDVVHVASLSSSAEIATIALSADDEPGRSVQDASGIVHVALRGAGELVSIDPADWTITARNATCAHPRGLTFDDARGVVLVACAGGELVAHTPGAAMAERVAVVPDLRDVFVQNGTVRVSRFRTAEVMDVDGGAVRATIAPPKTVGQRVPGTAYRTTPTPDGGWLMVHQSAVTEPIDLDPESGGVGPIRVTPYGGGGGGDDGGAEPEPCDGPVSAVLSMQRPDGEVVTSELLTLSTLAVDAAISPDGTRIAVAIAGQSDEGSETAKRERGVVLVNSAMLSVDPDADCHDPEDMGVPGQIIAVSFVTDELVIAQSREPAALYLVDVDERSWTEIPLAGDSVRDTGHDLFHQDAGVGLSCASCHPEGGDDGRVWMFAPGPVPRRTQSLRAGVAGTEPFHWVGDLATFSDLAVEVHSRRMGAAAQSEERIAAFQEWVFAIPTSTPQRSVDDALAMEGRDVFVAAGCAECHTDQALADGKMATIDGIELQVPTLRGIALHPPYMHDGRAADLAGSVRDMLRTTAPDIVLSDDEIAATVAYLESL